MTDTVYVLGAGSNQTVTNDYGLRPPITKNLFPLAKSWRTYRDLNYRDRMAAFFDWAEARFSVTADLLEAEGFDLEQLFTALEQDLHQALNQGDDSEIRSAAMAEHALKWLLIEFLRDFSPQWGRALVQTGKTGRG